MRTRHGRWIVRSVKIALLSATFLAAQFAGAIAPDASVASGWGSTAAPASALQLASHLPPQDDQPMEQP